jgi:hypothetical protein
MLTVNSPEAFERMMQPSLACPALWLSLVFSIRKQHRHRPRSFHRGVLAAHVVSFLLAGARQRTDSNQFAIASLAPAFKDGKLLLLPPRRG